MLWNRGTRKARAPQRYELPPVLPPPDPDVRVLVMHKGLGPPRIDVVTRAEADRKAGLLKKPKRK